MDLEQECKLLGAEKLSTVVEHQVEKDYLTK